MTGKKAEKLFILRPEHREALAALYARPEFKALERLFRIEESNIVIQSFKVPATDPELKTRKAHFEGRLYELRKIAMTFKEASKGEDEE